MINNHKLAFHSRLHKSNIYHLCQINNQNRINYLYLIKTIYQMLALIINHFKQNSFYKLYNNNEKNL